MTTCPAAAYTNNHLTSATIMDNFLRLVASPTGRAARVAIGAALLGAGLVQARKNWGLAALGLLPLAMGGADLCLLAPLQGLPFDGPKLRETLGPVPA
jgi:hypothetical protein